MVIGATRYIIKNLHKHLCQIRGRQQHTVIQKLQSWVHFITAKKSFAERDWIHKKCVSVKWNCTNCTSKLTSTWVNNNKDVKFLCPNLIGTFFTPETRVTHYQKHFIKIYRDARTSLCSCISKELIYPALRIEVDEEIHNNNNIY